MQTTNGFNPIVAKVKYIDYTQSEEVQKQIWIKFFKKEIYNLNNKTIKQ